MDRESKIPVSVILCVKNEGEIIADCLKRLGDFAEVLVVDDESTDNTAQIAKDYGARVIRRRMENEGTHRNIAAQLARHDWVFFIDADEWVTPELAGQIRQAFQEGKYQGVPIDDICAFTMPVDVFIGGVKVKASGWAPSYKTVLFDRRHISYAKEPVHPSQLSTGQKKRVFLTGRILHRTYSSFSNYIEKVNRHTSNEVLKCKIKKFTPTFFWAARKGVSIFIKRYFVKQGYKDGITGLCIAYVSAVYPFLVYLKYKEARQKDMAPRIVFLDRDGVINASPGEGRYVRSKDEFLFLPNVIEALKLMKDKGYFVFIVSNQSGVGRGLYTRDDLDEIDRHMKEALLEEGIHIDGAFYCIHAPDEGCGCRKPALGLFEKALERFKHVDYDKVIMVGDSPVDVAAARNLGIRSCIVLTGKTKTEDMEMMPDFFAKDLLDFAIRLD